MRRRCNLATGRENVASLQELLAAVDEDIEEHVLRGVTVLTARQLRAWLKALRAELADEELSGEDVGSNPTTTKKSPFEQPACKTSDERAYEQARSLDFARLREVWLEHTKDKSCWEV